MKHRFVRRVSALALAGCLLAGSSLPAFAAASAAKEEVIYANLTASGAVTGVYAVNSFSVQAGDCCGPRQLHCRAQHDHERCRGAERRYGHGACDRGRQALL